MKKVLLIFLLLPLFAQAQGWGTMWGNPVDSTTFTFATGDTLTKNIFFYVGDTAQIAVDTSGANLWQIGSTTKVGFIGSADSTRGIMTDTLNPYPSNANSSFVVKVGFIPNIIVSFWHHYATDSMHAGGIVEFSTDRGATWLNVRSCPGIGSFNFYTATDTIFTGVAAFRGTSANDMPSGVFFFDCAAIRTTSTDCFPNTDYHGSIFLRFRFISDTSANSLALPGWIIDSIKIDGVGCSGYVSPLDKASRLDIFPDPASDVLNISCSSQIRQVVITDVLGKTRYSHSFSANDTQIDISALPGGVYFVRVNDEYVRKLIKQ